MATTIEYDEIGFEKLRFDIGHYMRDKWLVAVEDSTTRRLQCNICLEEYKQEFDKPETQDFIKFYNSIIFDDGQYKLHYLEHHTPYTKVDDKIWKAIGR
jgi:hypothetical protein